MHRLIQFHADIQIVKSRHLDSSCKWCLMCQNDRFYKGDFCWCMLGLFFNANVQIVKSWHVNRSCKWGLICQKWLVYKGWFCGFSLSHNLFLVDSQSAKSQHTIWSCKWSLSCQNDHLKVDKLIHFDWADAPTLAERKIVVDRHLS